MLFLYIGVFGEYILRNELLRTSNDRVRLKQKRCRSRLELYLKSIFLDFDRQRPALKKTGSKLFECLKVKEIMTKVNHIDPDTFHIFVKKGNRSMQKNFLTQSQLFPAIKFSSIIQGSTDLQAC